MQKEVTITYTTNDGTKFKDEGKAYTYESMKKIIDSTLVKYLVPTPKDFGDNHDYVQQDVEKVRKCKKAIFVAASELIKHDWLQDVISKVDDVNFDDTWVTYLLGDYNYGYKCLDAAWYRMCSITKDGKEFNQPYYAQNDKKYEENLPYFNCLNPELVGERF